MPKNGPIQLPVSVEAKRSTGLRRSTVASLFAVLALLAGAAWFGWQHSVVTPDVTIAAKACAQADPSLPSRYNLTEIYAEKDAIIERLQGAVSRAISPATTPRLTCQIRIPTQMYDEMGPVDSDPRWQTIGQFHECASMLSVGLMSRSGEDLPPCSQAPQAHGGRLGPGIRVEGSRLFAQAYLPHGAPGRCPCP